MYARRDDPVPDDALIKDLDDAIAALDSHGKRQVLSFARTLDRRRRADGPGGPFLAFAGAITADDLALMDRAIADGCETVDSESW